MQEVKTFEDYVNGFRAVTRPGTPFVALVNGTNSNLAYLRVSRFWSTYYWFQKRSLEDEPVRGGLFDLNRYYYFAE